MALFGTKRTDPMAGLPGAIIGYGGGTFNPDGSQATPARQTFDQAFGTGSESQADIGAPKKSGGLFGQNSALWKVLGTVGDSLSAVNGIAPTYAPMMAQQRQHQQTMAEKAAEREATYQREMDLARFKATLPANNDTANDYAFIAQHLGKDAADKYLGNIGDPIVTVQLPGNRVYSGPRSGMAAALGGGQSTPITADDWNKGTPVGGGASNGTSGFRP